MLQTVQYAHYNQQASLSFSQTKEIRGRKSDFCCVNIKQRISTDSSKKQTIIQIIMTVTTIFEIGLIKKNTSDNTNSNSNNDYNYNNLPMSHFVPVYPASQVQLYPLIKSVQLP